VLVYDAALELEPQLIRLTAAAASLALEHSRLQAEVEAQLELVRASRARIVEAGDAERRRLERDLHDGAQQRLVTLTLALGMARSRAAGADPELLALIDSASKEAKEALTSCASWPGAFTPRSSPRPGCPGNPGAGRALAGGHHGDRGAAREVPGHDRGHRVLRGLRGAGQRGQARPGQRRPGERAQAPRLPDRAGQRRRSGRGRPGRGSGLRGLADRVASAGGVLRVDSSPSWACSWRRRTTAGSWPC
jgi:hypothetical protein